MQDGIYPLKYNSDLKANLSSQAIVNSMRNIADTKLFNIFYDCGTRAQFNWTLSDDMKAYRLMYTLCIFLHNRSH